MTAASPLARRVADRAARLRGDGVRARAGPGSRAGGHDFDEQLAGFLGWFSIGLGLTEVLAPRGLARFIGLRGDATDCTVLRLFGLRELAAGVGILARPRPSGWVWSRVAGDAMDLAFLGRALASGPPRPDRVAGAAAAVLGVTALDVYDAVQLGRRPGAPGRAREGRFEVRRAITVHRPAEELYRFWRDFRNLPRFMSHLQSVEVLDERRSRWKAKGPAGTAVEWDAEIIEDRPGGRISWRSLEGADVDNSGSVGFTPAPGGRGTEVLVELRYGPPGGALGAWVARLFGEAPEQQVADDLRRFKQVMETGEVVLSDGGLDGSRLAQPPAQPRRE